MSGATEDMPREVGEREKGTSEKGVAVSFESGMMNSSLSWFASPRASAISAAICGRTG